MFAACCPYAAANIAPLLLRLAIGTVFVYHGWPKLMDLEKTAGMMQALELPMPHVQAVLAASAEVGCGALLIAGLFTRLAAIPLVITMLVAIWKVHYVAFGLQHKGMEYNTVLIAGLLSLMFTGAGTLSLDELLFGKRTCGPAPAYPVTPETPKPAAG